MNRFEMRVALRGVTAPNNILDTCRANETIISHILYALTSKPAFKHQVPRPQSDHYGCNEEPKNPVVYPIQNELEWLQRPGNVRERWHSALVNEEGRFRVIVSFENAEDAVLFKMRFGG